MSLKSIITKQSLKAAGVSAVIMAAVVGILFVGGCGKDKRVETAAAEDASESAAQSRVCDIEEGPFTDARDGKTYRTVKIGDLLWMAENLNYAADSSWCFENETANCDKYGRLYTWDAAMKSCPKGWRLPDSADWVNLLKTAGGACYDLSIIRACDKPCGMSWENAGTKLKSQTGWSHDRNGTDEYGFSAQPAGHRFPAQFEDYSFPALPEGRSLPGCGDSESPSFFGTRVSGSWWSSTEYDAANAWFHSMGHIHPNVSSDPNGKGMAFSVRCVCGLLTETEEQEQNTTRCEPREHRMTIDDLIRGIGGLRK